MYLQKNSELLEDSYKVAKVLDILVTKMMKQSATNEIMALKFCYLGNLVKQADKSRKDKGDDLQGWIKL